MNEYPEFNGWQAVHSLGTGKVGESFEIVRDDGFGLEERGVLKIIDITAETDPEAAQAQRAQLEAAARTLRSADSLGEHRNILPWRDHAIRRRADGTGWQICLRTDLVTPLERYLRSHTYGERDVVHMAAGVLSALQLCHSRDIVHGDIKPQNLFVSDSNYEDALELRLGDFGMAPLSPGAAGDFAAPEVLCGETPTAEHDLYSLGMVLYWMLNDRRVPFVPLPPATVSGSDLAIARDMRLRGDPIPEPLHGSAALKDVIMQAIADQPADRFETAEEFRAALLAAVRPAQTAQQRAQAQRAAQQTAQAEARAAREQARAPEEATREPKRRSKVPAIVIGSIFGVALIILLVVMALGGSSSKKELGALSMNVTEAELAPKDTLQLSVELRDPDDKRVSVKAEDIEWSTSVERVAAVDDNGLVTAGEEGKARITAEYSEDGKRVSATCDVTVTKDAIKITAVELDPTSAELEVGETLNLVAKLTPSDAPTDKLSWTSSYESVATVKNGVVTAVKPGTTTITVQANGQTARCSVTVKDPAEIKRVTSSDSSVNFTAAGESRTITFTVTGKGLDTFADTAKVYAVDGSIAQVGTLQRTTGTDSDTYSVTVTALREGMTTVAFEIRGNDGTTHSATTQIMIVFPVEPDNPDAPGEYDPELPPEADEIEP